MKVLLWTRPNDVITGGDLLQAKNTKEYLEMLGVEVDITDAYGLEPWKLDNYDIIHLFVLNVVNNFDKIKNMPGKNIIFSPIYRDENYGE
jgi:hypothetical protein